MFNLFLSFWSVRSPLSDSKFVYLHLLTLFCYNVNPYFISQWDVQYFKTVLVLLASRVLFIYLLVLIYIGYLIVQVYCNLIYIFKGTLCSFHR